jgi:hypothetical protein
VTNQAETTHDSNPGAPESSGRNLRPIVDCMEACLRCEMACLACADACLWEGDLLALRRCIRLDLDCADICATTARFLARRADAETKLLRAIVEACARACATCASECNLFESDHEHCRICAEACRLCAERCGGVLRELPDAHGETHPPVTAAGASSV